MKLSMDQDVVTLETLAEVIAHSQIMVKLTAHQTTRLPAGFDASDIAILDWIVAEGRRVGPGLIRM